MRVWNQIRRVLVTFLLLAAAVLYGGSASPAWAQSTNTGTLAGTVTDATNAVVNGATVTLTDNSTKNSRYVTTNEAGRYIFVDVVPGTYDVTIEKQGFSTSKTQTTVTVGTAATVNMALAVGGGNVVVEVTAVGNELQTMNPPSEIRSPALRWRHCPPWVVT